MDIFLQQIINGLTAGSVYALVALGLVLLTVVQTNASCRQAAR